MIKIKQEQYLAHTKYIMMMSFTILRNDLYLRLILNLQ